MAVQQQHQQARYVGRADPAESFADSIQTMVWDGTTLRVEFCVTRFAEAEAAGERLAERHPVCRLVLTAPAAVDLFNRLQQTMQALSNTGVVSPQQRPK